MIPRFRSVSGWSPPYSPTCFGRRNFGSRKNDHEPLRVLFCGADEFSIYSLRALQDLRAKKPHKIKSIDVVCRPDKRVGRGLKQLNQVPIKSVATDLDLPLHQIDTFTGWSPPESINLIIAVSFGLLVPPRLLQAAKYGGLNVHPSLLPDLRGSAPIQHTLLRRRSYTGVTLQTMHPTRFDHGAILAQTPAPGVPVPKSCAPAQLLATLGPLGADMLCQSLDHGLFVEPLRVLDVGRSPSEFPHASKIRPEERHINWQTWTADDIMLRDRVLGRLWDTTTYVRCHPSDGEKVSKRVTFTGPWSISTPNLDRSCEGVPLGKGNPQPHDGESGKTISIIAADGVPIEPAAITIEGEKKDQGRIKLYEALVRRRERINVRD